MITDSYLRIKKYVLIYFFSQPQIRSINSYSPDIIKRINRRKKFTTVDEISGLIEEVDVDSVDVILVFLLFCLLPIKRKKIHIKDLQFTWKRRRVCGN